MNYSSVHRNLSGKNFYNVLSMGEKAYYASKRNNISDANRKEQYELAQQISSYVLDELARQERLKTMKTRRNSPNNNYIIKAKKKVYLPSPLGPYKTRRNRKH